MQYNRPQAEDTTAGLSRTISILDLEQPGVALAPLRHRQLFLRYIAKSIRPNTAQPNKICPLLQRSLRRVVLAEFLIPNLILQQVLLPHVPTLDLLLLPAMVIPALDRYEQLRLCRPVLLLPEGIL